MGHCPGPIKWLALLGLLFMCPTNNTGRAHDAHAPYDKHQNRTGLTPRAQMRLAAGGDGAPHRSPAGAEPACARAAATARLQMLLPVPTPSSESCVRPPQAALLNGPAAVWAWVYLSSYGSSETAMRILVNTHQGKPTD